LKNKTGYSFFKVLSPLDIGTIFYVLFSTIFICVAASSIKDVWTHFALRVAIICLIVILAILNKKFPNKILLLLKNTYPLLFLNYFYAETAFIKNIIFDTDLDIYFMRIDQWLFGCQPAIEFSKFMPQAWFYEGMFMSYFSYYLLTAIVCISIYFEKAAESYRTIFIIIISFYLYYIFYIIFPVVGPQYYFNTSAYQPNQPYIFGKIMCFLHTMERATGAFPSSHVGMAVIFSYIFFKHIKKLFFITLPFVIGICFATIYLKEHYVIDVIGGMVSAPLFIVLSGLIYDKFLSFKTHKQL
jgi:membrane-associated phospholipid phosphatase